MGASPKQVKLVNDLMEVGAVIPEHPQFDRPDDPYESVEAADRFIKANKHLIPKLGHRRTLNEISERNSPVDWGGIPNH